MLLLDWRLALVTFLVLLLLYLVRNRLQVRLRDAYRTIRTRLSRVNVYVQGSISGMVITPQRFNCEQRSFERFDALNADYLNASLRSVFLFSVLYPSVTVIGSLAIAAIIW